MEQQDIAHEIFRIAEPVVRSLDLAIWGIEIIPSGRTLVRIYVDTKPGAPAEGPAADASGREAGGTGPGIDQCANVSRHIGLALDAEDLIPGSYVLEVSSPGLQRPFFQLAQLEPYLGEDVELRLDSAQPELPGRKRLRGRLRAVGGQGVSLLAYDAPDGTLLTIPWDKVRKASLAPALPFSKFEKPGKKKTASRTGATSQ